MWDRPVKLANNSYVLVLEVVETTSSTPEAVKRFLYTLALRVSALMVCHSEASSMDAAFNLLADARAKLKHHWGEDGSGPALLSVNAFETNTNLLSSIGSAATEARRRTFSGPYLAGFLQAAIAFGQE